MPTHTRAPKLHWFLIKPAAHNLVFVNLLYQLLHYLKDFFKVSPRPSTINWKLSTLLPGENEICVLYKFDYYDYVYGGIHPTFLHSLNFYSIIYKVIHSYPLAFLLIKNWPRCVTHVLMVSGHPWARGKYQPNQTIPVFGLFGLQSWLTSGHVCGHVARATCILRAPMDSPWVVDDVRHWNFSICY